MKSGWCAAPIGARPHCGECVSLVCDCACHHDQTCAACLAPVPSDTHHETCVAPLDVLAGESRSTQGESVRSTPTREAAMRYDKGTNKTAPNAEFAPPAGASSTLIRSAN